MAASLLWVESSQFLFFIFSQNKFSLVNCDTRAPSKAANADCLFVRESLDIDKQIKNNKKYSIFPSIRKEYLGLLEKTFQL